MAKSVLLFVFFLLSAAVLIAQPGTDPGGGGPPAPITGLEYLIGGGALLAGRYFYKRHKKDN